jgi:hypothetical protein
MNLKDRTGRLLSRSALSTAGITVVVLAVFILIEHAMGRVPWCACGLGIWTSNAWGGDTSQHLADPYTSSHVLHGIIFYWALYFLAPKLLVRYRLIIALLLEVGWEILENSPIIIDRYRAATASLDYLGDSILNSTGDVLFALAGFWLAYRLPWKLILALSIAVELIMLLLYRDNLTLNVLMLIYPIDAIKEWQMMR